MKLQRLVGPHERGIRLDRSIPGRSRAYWITRRYGRWNVHLPGLSFKTAQFPRFWLVSAPLSVAWWPRDPVRLALRIGRWWVR